MRCETSPARLRTVCVGRVLPPARAMGLHAALCVLRSARCTRLFNARSALAFRRRAQRL